jgi:uncharacterized protein
MVQMSFDRQLTAPWQRHKLNCMTMEVGPNFYWRSALAAGKFLLQVNPATGEYIFPPRVMAPHNGANDLNWVEASGYGTVYSVTVISPKPPALPYNVALITLAEGPRLMSRVEGLNAADVSIGLQVKARVSTSEAGPLLLFDAV